MPFHRSPQSLRHILLALLFSPRPSIAGPHVPNSIQAGFNYNELFARYECSGEVCGYYGQKCCSAGSACYTNSLDQAACGAATEPSNGHWTYYTTTYVETDLQTITATMSSYVSPVSVAAQPTPTCDSALSEAVCGSICCSASQYCNGNGQCVASEASSSERVSSWVASRTGSPSPPVRGTSSVVSVVTQTNSPTTTVPFETPVATNANITLTGNAHSSSSLSGGDIAGIVIGVLVGLFLLGLLCFCCCLRGLFDGLLAIFGLGRNRRTTEVEEYERRSHYDSRGNKRTWYGAPKRTGSRRSEKEKSHTTRNIIGIGAGLAAMWAILGLKRRSETRRENDRQTVVSDYTYYSDDYYTSASSASSDRRTRVTRDTRRSVSRRP